MARSRAVYLIPLIVLLFFLARKNLSSTYVTTRTIAAQQLPLERASTIAASSSQIPRRTASLSPPPPPPPPPAQSLAAAYSSRPAAVELVPPAVQQQQQQQQQQPQQLQQPQPQPQPQQPQPQPQQAVSAATQCTSLSCAGRFTKAEPAWAQLAFQPRIDWAAGGIRGDCVAGELEYIMGKYCSPQPRAGNWPSEERLNQIDVHSQGKPKSDLADIVRLLPNRTILLMGDSVMEQFYNTLQCFLRREGIELPNDVRALAPPPAAAALHSLPLSMRARCSMHRRLRGTQSTRPPAPCLRARMPSPHAWCDRLCCSRAPPACPAADRRSPS